VPLGPADAPTGFFTNYNEFALYTPDGSRIVFGRTKGDSAGMDFTGTSALIDHCQFNYNGKEDLERCLLSLLRVDYPNFEIIVVDNNSIDGSLEMARTKFPRISFCCETLPSTALRP